MVFPFILTVHATTEPLLLNFKTNSSDNKCFLTQISVPPWDVCRLLIIGLERKMLESWRKSSESEISLVNHVSDKQTMSTELANK